MTTCAEKRVAARGGERLARALRWSAMMAAAACLAPAALAAPPIMIEKQGSFSAGGKVVANADGSQTLRCDQGYVAYQVPVRARKIALFLWHSSSAHVWEQRWDGGEGFQSILLRQRYPTYVWDGPRVGRGNMSCEEHGYKPVQGQDQRNFLAWRFGPEPGNWYPGLQFPTGDAEAYDQAMAARYVEYDIAKNAHLEGRAGAKAIDRIGPSVALTNSAGNWRAMIAALHSNSLKGIVAYEPAAFIFPEGEGPAGPEGGFGPTHVPIDEFMKLTRIPIQIVWGDNINERWEPRVALSRQFAAIVNRLGGKAEVLMLPSAGLKGNTHIPFADLNNDKVAELLFLFLRKHKLDR